MFLWERWTSIVRSRRTREREAAAAAQYERVQREGALRDDFARRTHAFEAQIAQAHAENCRLRAENRALLNSVLGIAGIPPVIVAEPPPTFIEGASADAAQSPGEPDLPFVGAQHAVPGADAWREAAHTPAPSSADTRTDAAHLPDTAELPFVGAQHAVPGADAWREAAHTPTPSSADTRTDATHSATTPIPERRHSERSVAHSFRSPLRHEQPLFVSTGCVGAQSKRGPSSLMELAPQHDGTVGDTVAHDGAASPSTDAGRSGATPLPKQSPGAISSRQNGGPESRQTPLDPTPSTLIPPEAAASPAQKELRRGRPSPAPSQTRRARTAPRPRNDAHAIAPIRRRSWHQIYRMLEFESSRRKDQES